jgi:uncharacterized LabA/DUF88 family protein
VRDALSGVLLFWENIMSTEPSIKRTIAFIDGQNLFHSVKDAFGYPYPNYDPIALSSEVCALNNFSLDSVRFYTGIPDILDDKFWHAFWSKKLQFMGTRNIVTYSRPLKYRNTLIKLKDGSISSVPVGREKGIDIRMALDIVRLAIDNVYDVALIFSQDQDLSEATDEVRKISIQQSRWIKSACAFPVSPTCNNKRGINNTEWKKFDKALYDKCIDPNDYRSKAI